MTVPAETHAKLEKMWRKDQIIIKELRAEVEKLRLELTRSHAKEG